METVVVDGNLLEWLGAEWFPLFESFNQAGVSSIALRADSVHAYIAFDIKVPSVRVQPGTRVGEGDHMAVVIDTDPADGRIGPQDLYVLLSPPTDTETDPIVTSLRFEGFMAKWLADNRALTFTEFHLSTFGADPSSAMGAGVTYATRRTSDGYVAELALPHMGREQIHLSLTVTSTGGRKRVWSLSRRNYPANPATFAVVELRATSREL